MPGRAWYGWAPSGGTPLPYLGVPGSYVAGTDGVPLIAPINTAALPSMARTNGENTYLLVPMDGLYGFGVNANYELGLGHNSPVNVPTLLKAGNFLAVAPTQLGAIASRDDGTLWVAGHNDQACFGQAALTTVYTTWTQVTWFPTLPSGTVIQGALAAGPAVTGVAVGAGIGPPHAATDWYLSGDRRSGQIPDNSIPAGSSIDPTATPLDTYSSLAAITSYMTTPLSGSMLAFTYQAAAVAGFAVWGAVGGGLSGDGHIYAGDYVVSAPIDLRGSWSLSTIYGTMYSFLISNVDPFTSALLCWGRNPYGECGVAPGPVSSPYNWSPGTGWTIPGIAWPGYLNVGPFSSQQWSTAGWAQRDMLVTMVISTWDSSTPAVLFHAGSMAPHPGGSYFPVEARQTMGLLSTVPPVGKGYDGIGISTHGVLAAFIPPPKGGPFIAAIGA